MNPFKISIAKRENLNDFCKHRKMMAKLIEYQYKNHALIEDKMKTFYRLEMPQAAQFRGSFEDAIKDLDKMYWRRAFDHTNLMRLLDAESKRELQANPTAFTLENIFRQVFLIRTKKR